MEQGRGGYGVYAPFLHPWVLIIFRCEWQWVHTEKLFSVVKGLCSWIFLCSQGGSLRCQSTRGPMEDPEGGKKLKQERAKVPKEGGQGKAEQFPESAEEEPLLLSSTKVMALVRALLRVPVRLSGHIPALNPSVLLRLFSTRPPAPYVFLGFSWKHRIGYAHHSSIWTDLLSTCCHPR